MTAMDDDLQAATALIESAQAALRNAKLAINGLRPLQAAPLPAWVGDEPVIETMTYGQGDFGQRCRLCGEDDYGSAISHLSGCPAKDMDVELLKERTDLDLEKGV